MRRWGLVGLISAVLLSLAAPAWALEPSEVLDGLRDHGKEWLKDKAKDTGKDWLLGTDQSATMEAILEKATEVSERSDLPGKGLPEPCKLAIYSQVYSVLHDLHYATSFKEGASVALGAAAKTVGLAVGGLGAAGEGGALDWLAGQYADAAKGQAEDSVFDRLAKAFADEKAAEFEVFEKDGSCGLGRACKYELKAEWDIVHGRYTVYMHGDCDCSRQGAGGGVTVGEWWVYFSGPMLMHVGEDKKTVTWTPGDPDKIDAAADCPCTRKKPRRAFATEPPMTAPPPPIAGPPPPPPPTTIDSWLKVTTRCKDCEPITAEINTVAQERQAVSDEQNQAQTELEQAKSQVDIDSQGGDKELGIPAPTPAKVAADKAALDAAKAKVTALGAKGAALDARLKTLWTKLKDCEKEKCGTYGMVVPTRPGNQAVAMGRALAGCPPQPPADASSMDVAVLAEINRARTDPQVYARALKGADAAEAVAFLDKEAPVAPFAPDDRLAAAALREAADQGPLGGYSHTGTDGSTPMSRIQATCLYAMIVGEEISLAQKQASGVVRQLIIDAASPSHFHRGDLFSASFKLAGVACGPNKTYGEMCVIDLAATPMTD